MSALAGHRANPFASLPFGLLVSSIKSHRIPFGLSAAALAASLVLGGVASHNKSLGSAVSSVGSIANQAGSAAASGVNGFYSGRASALFGAVENMQELLPRLEALREHVGPLSMPAMRNAVNGVDAAAVQLHSALSAIEVNVRAASDLSAALGQYTGKLAELHKRGDGSGRLGARALESLARLVTYAEGGFGPASVARIEYDMRVVSNDLAGTELRSDWQAIEKAVYPLARKALAEPISRDQLTRVLDAGGALARAGKAASGNAGFGVATLLALAAAGLAVLGLGSLVAGLLSIARDHEKRTDLAGATADEERARREGLAQGLRLVAEGDFTVDITGFGQGDLMNLTTAVSQLIERLKGSIGSLDQALKSGASDAEHAAGQVQAVAMEADTVVAMIEQAGRALAQACRSCAGLYSDAQATTFAASSMLTQVGDVARLTQEAASKLEAMRESLQDTSKGVKRVGERSQEIGAVSGIFESLIEQIQALSLNAHLEAERAGEGGRAFRRIAQEADLITKRGAEELKKVGPIIRGIQADSRSANEAAERSTNQVVSGAHLSAVAQSLTSAVVPLAEALSGLAGVLGEEGAKGFRVASEALTQSEDAAKSCGAMRAGFGTAQHALSSLNGNLRAGSELASGFTY